MVRPNRALCFVVVAAGMTTKTSAFYLPGVAPHEYEEGEEVLLKVNKMTSSRTQLPYDYYDLPL